MVMQKTLAVLLAFSAGCQGLSAPQPWHGTSQLAFQGSPLVRLQRHGMQMITETNARSPRFARFPVQDMFRRPLHIVKSTTGGAAVVIEDTESAQTAAPEQKRVAATEYFKPLVAGDILESTPSQQAIVAGSTALLAAMMAKASWIAAADPASFSLIWATVAILIGYEFADFGSGVYHWAMDNYGNKETPIFGGQIEAFQGHHELPWTITYRQVCNNIYKVCQASSPFCLAFLLLVDNPYVLMWATTAILFINLSQELHKWSHSSPSDTHPIVNALQARCWTGERLLADKVEQLGIKKPSSSKSNQ